MSRLALHQTLPLAFILAASQINFAAELSSATQPAFAPDPLAVQRHGPAWRYPQDGWIVVHIEGSAYERGYQHGRLLAPEIVDYCRAIAKIRNHEAPNKAWRDLRLFVNALFLRRFDREYLQEMQGIADGVAAGGGKLDGRSLDLLDIVVINADVEVTFLEAALQGTATGIETIKFFGRHGASPGVQPRERCSAFVATGQATADGKLVLGHITMSSLAYVSYYNVWLDIQPSQGHRLVFQTFPGGIQSGLDYYINSAGLIVAETTIEQTKFHSHGEMLASRIRRVLQYADSIDRAVEILTSSNNGLYTNEWLLGDIKTNEIAMFELGTDRTRLWRSSRDEWFGGTKGFYWGCNNVKDVGVYRETVADLGGKPANLVLYPRIRDEAWLKLFRQREGKIDENFGFEAYSTPPLAAFPSCDAKFTTAALAKDLKSWALFGPPLGRTWMPSQREREELPSVQPLVPHDWTLIDVRGVKLPPASQEGQRETAVADLEPFPKPDDPLHVKFDERHPFAWRGTLLPQTDADVWLAAGFAEFEKVVALEHALWRDVRPAVPSSGSRTESAAELDDSGSGVTKITTSHTGARAAPALSQAARDLVDLALFQHESRWLTAVRRVGHDVPLASTRPVLEDRDGYDIAAGKGVLLLAALRKQWGDEAFDRAMDEFGRMHAGQTVTTEQFRRHIEHSEKPALVALLDRWLTTDMSSEFKSHNPWTIFSHEREPDQVLIVYGTQHDRAAQREAADKLQGEIARRFANVFCPMKGDRDVTADDRKSFHLLLIGRPETNRLTAECLDQSSNFPVRFGTQSFNVAGQKFAHHGTFVIAAGENPFNPRYSVVLFAGLDAASTWCCVQNLPDDDELNPQVILKPVGRSARRFRAGIR